MRKLMKGDVTWICLALVAVALVLVVCMSPTARVVAETSGTVTELDIVRVSGHAEVKVAPDKSSVVIYVQSKASTAKAANEGLGTKSDAVISALKGAGVKAENIQTSYFSVDEQYKWVDGTRKSDGYLGECGLEVTGVDIDKIGAVIDAAINAGADSVGRVRYYSSDYDECYNKALKEAIAEAKAKADTMGAAAGFKVIRVHTITEGYQNDSVKYTEDVKMDFAVSNGVSSAESTISAGEVAVGAYVTVEYVIG